MAETIGNESPLFPTSPTRVGGLNNLLEHDLNLSPSNINTSFDDLIRQEGESVSALMSHVNGQKEKVGPPQTRRIIGESNAFINDLIASTHVITCPTSDIPSRDTNMYVRPPSRWPRSIITTNIGSNGNGNRVQFRSTNNNRYTTNYRPPYYKKMLSRNIKSKRTLTNRNVGNSSFTLDTLLPQTLPRRVGKIPVHQDHPMLNFNVIFQHSSATKRYDGYKILSRVANIFAPTTFGKDWCPRMTDGGEIDKVIQDLQKWVNTAKTNGIITNTDISDPNEPNDIQPQIIFPSSPPFIPETTIDCPIISEPEQLDEPFILTLQDGNTSNRKRNLSSLSSSSSCNSSSSSSSSSSCSDGSQCSKLRKTIKIPPIQQNKHKQNQGNTNLKLIKTSQAIFKFDSILGISKQEDIQELKAAMKEEAKKGIFLMKLLMKVHPLLRGVRWGEEGYNKYPLYKEIKDGLINTLTSENFLEAFGPEFKTTKKLLDSNVRNMQGLAKKYLNGATLLKRVERSDTKLRKFFQHFVQLR